MPGRDTARIQLPRLDERLAEFPFHDAVTVNTGVHVPPCHQSVSAAGYGLYWQVSVAMPPMTFNWDWVAVRYGLFGSAALGDKPH